MNSNQLERAAYMAAHAVLRADTSASELACPGARRTHTVDTIAGIIKSIFELHCGNLDDYTDWETPSARPARGEKILPIRAETAAQVGR